MLGDGTFVACYNYSTTWGGSKYKKEWDGCVILTGVQGDLKSKWHLNRDFKANLSGRQQVIWISMCSAGDDPVEATSWGSCLFQMFQAENVPVWWAMNKKQSGEKGVREGWGKRWPPICCWGFRTLAVPFFIFCSLHFTNFDFKESCKYT